MKIAILGAGIGGLTMAQCLNQLGYSFDLFESSEGIKAVGAGIWMPPNAMQVFAKIDKDKEVMETGIPLLNMQICDLSLKPLGLVDGEKLASKYLYRTVSIKRHELHSILLKGFPSESVHLGHQCVEIKRQNKKIILTFKNGLVSEYDLVIGADGIHSITRKALGDLRQLQYSGQTCLRGIANVEVPDNLKKKSFEIWGHGARYGCSPVGNNEIYWYAPFAYESGHQFTNDQKIKILKTIYSSFPEMVQKVIAETQENSIIQTDLFELPLGQTWSQSGIILLGDAAHSMTPNLGQGAAMAIEDAYELALLIKNYNNDLNTMAAQYNQNRVERVNQIALWARQLGSIANFKNPILCGARNFLFSKTPRSIQNKQIDFIYQSPFRI